MGEQGMRRRHGMLVGCIAALLIAADAAASDPVVPVAAPVHVAPAVGSASEDDALPPLLIEWQTAHAEAVCAHLRGLAAADDARGLAVAALLSPMAMAPDGSSEELPRDVWLARAVTLGTGDPLVLWLQATRCSTDPACDQETVLAALKGLVGEDLDVRLLALSAAIGRGDASAAAAHLHAAVESDRVLDPFNGWTRLLYAELLAMQAPAPSPEVAGMAGELFDFGRPVTVADVAGVSALAVATAFVLPATAHLTRFCRADAQERRDDCLRVYARLAEGRSLMEASIAVVSGVELSGLQTDQADRHVWRERLRQNAWLRQHVPVVPGEVLPLDYFERFIEAGELAALGDRLAAAGLPRQAPDGWLPDDARLRRLIVKGRESEPEAARGD
ncbi:hypothetical protein [Xanthomonas sp. XNM01]|uniref:hypothetical protein n=1 Tax=Xanthomonas sp. XNM01 TaxID=2769289 RepID=UPI00177DDB9D|nr:hypothetical protein [Xanthomonas sp. XNM01]